MTLLIDGYNLLHASGILGRGRGPGGFERSRLALLNFIAESLPAETASKTTVVFDAAHAPPGMPRVLNHRGICVRFAASHTDADSLIEELIRADSAPRQLVVVSSDHRLHRAARRRRAQAVDSDRWYAETLRTRRNSTRKPAVAAKPAALPGADEVAYWLARFADDTIERQAAAEQIFPPGYAEDLGDE
ncbi:MAG TPA: NYN domain-containing protein [Pirellulales bacterium]|nr:NYN domain-containing protein [Pirellulales bacterium]